MKPIILEKLIPEHIGKNRVKLLKRSAAEVPSPYPGGAGDQMDGLLGLYQKAGVHEIRKNQTK